MLDEIYPPVKQVFVALFGVSEEIYKVKIGEKIGKNDDYDQITIVPSFCLFTSKKIIEPKDFFWFSCVRNFLLYFHSNRLDLC